MKDVLSARVSYFIGYKTKIPSGDVEILKFLRSEKYKEKIEQIRLIDNKNERDRLKADLPAITPSCTCSRRSQAHVIKTSGLLQFDIDAKDNPTWKDFKDLQQMISDSPNIAYCGLSVSGRGLWGLIPVADPQLHKQHFKYVYKYFESKGIYIDKATSNIISLRGISYDPHAYFNCYAEPLTRYEFEMPRQTIKERGEGHIWQQYNQSDAYEDLLQGHGWQIDHRKGNKVYYTRPGKDRGVSAEFDQNEGVFYVFTSSTEFQANKGYSPFQVYAILEHEGDFKEATKALSRDLSLII